MVSERHSAGTDVALLIDFGNLVRGVERDVDCEALFRFAGQHGRVATATAYADWEADELSRYRAALRSLGVEPVHVPVRSDPARGVCIQMGVDAVDLSWSAPQVGVYVIVAEDGSLFPAVDALRRRVAGRPRLVVRGSRRSGAEARGSESLRLRAKVQHQFRWCSFPFMSDHRHPCSESDSGSGSGAQ